MVNQKKGAVKGKQQTPSGKFNKNKKEFEEQPDLDNSSSGETMKTPARRTPKGKQALSDKRVGFQIATRNTPGKNTPQNKNVVLGKQSTPGRMALKEFQGIMGKSTPTPNKNGKAKRPLEDDEEEEDDDDEDDDDDDDDDDGDLDMLLGGADDDEEDDDDDDEEDDDDDDDNEPPVQNTNQNKSINIKQGTLKAKTPVKNVEKTPAKEKSNTPAKFPKAALDTSAKGSTSPQKSPVKKQQPATPDLEKALKTEASARRERNIRTLFIGNLPKDVTALELKDLSSDIINVSLPRPSNRAKIAFAFIEFLNEAKAEENHTLLQKKKLRNETFYVDFTGEKRKNQSSAPESSVDVKHTNLKKLHLSSLPCDVTIYQLATLFPKSSQISLNADPSYRTAVLCYWSEAVCAEELEAGKDAQLSGKPFTACYFGISRKKRKEINRKNQQNPAKKMKMEVAQESDDDDDDDSDE